jgi:poly(3-hydroxybutyrate) depolymerase
MKGQPSVLVVAPLSGHHSTLLRDTVKSLLQDHKVFITDWTDARMVPLSEGPFHLDDYVGYVQEFLRHVGPDAHVISVCQPTVPVLAAVSLMASRGEPTPLTMTMMGGPIDARKSPTGQRPGGEQEPQLVREQRDLPRAAQLCRVPGAASTRASCSTPASWP